MPISSPLDNTHLRDLISQYIRRDYVPLRADVTVGKALETLRSQELGEKIVYFYVADAEGRLQGIVPTRRLLSDPRRLGRPNHGAGRGFPAGLGDGARRQ